MGGTELVPQKAYSTWVHDDTVFWPPYPSKETAKVWAAINRSHVMGVAPFSRLEFSEVMVGIVK